MSEIRKSLESLADSIEKIQNQPAPRPTVKDRELSGNKINGGVITNFSSVGIKDEASSNIIAVKNDGLHVAVVYTNKIANNLDVEGNLGVSGEITARKLHVDELSADVRNERTSPLEFKGDDKPLFGKGLIWTGGSYTKQLVLQGKPDRIWSSEDIDLHRDRSYKIGSETVLGKTALGQTVRDSSLRSVGTLQKLSVAGSVNIDEYLIYNSDTEQLSMGSENPHGKFSIESFDHQFIIDPTDDKNWKLGTWTTSGLDIITDDTTRIRISNKGKITVCSQTVFENAIGIGVKNFENDVDLTVAGAVRIDDRKQESGYNIPTSGNYIKGDTVWNTDPKPTGYIGWVCVKSGTPGDWKPFGQISS